ncbi:MAG TPA: hypothetical protein VKC90_16425 [Chitinophagaceae bacterium]|nr:hypothetical protein [Chitinophagaceae bacterium]
MSYTAEEHIHRYAVWTAARAQRAFMTNENIKKAIDKIKLKEEVIRFKTSLSINSIEFNDWHTKKCNELKDILSEIKNQKVSFGRAAKIINVYLKTSIVISGCSDNNNLITGLIHPPIDRILLINLIGKHKLSSKYKVAWTEMSEEVYTEIINELRKTFNSLWQAEEYWNLENE